MSAAYDVDAIALGLQRQYGLDAETARRKAQQIAGIPTAATVRSVPDVVAMPAIQWPVKLLLPWSYLISDNRRYGVINGKLLLTSDYRRAKVLVRDAARDALGRPNPEPASVPLELHARVWVPDEVRAHDVCNFAKAVHDALQGVVVTNDRWFWRTTWEHVGADVDAPRAEITIRPLAS